MPVVQSRIAVFGAGTMGAGIAQICLFSGAKVTLCDPSPDAQKRAQKSIEAEIKRLAAEKKLTKDEEHEIRARLRFAGGLVDCEGADLVIEAVFERLDVKQELFSRLDQHLAPPAILATNTSALSVTAIASKTRFSDRVCGLHFFNPPAKMKLVEVVAAEQTSSDTVEHALSFVREIGKEPIRVEDTPGFVVNRCARPFYGEALRCLGEGIADVQTIDRILREGGGFKSGPFEELDRIGLDMDYGINRAIYEGCFRDGRFRPHLIEKKMVEAGRLGRKSGRGFYEYPDAQ
jgi:3-hydroxybutyryl-CoA dehydrogenase